MSFRGAEVYVEQRTKRRLRWLSKAIGGGDKPLTADALADQLLNEVIETRFPQIKDIEDVYEQAEKRLAEALQR